MYRGNKRPMKFINCSVSSGMDSRTFLFYLCLFAASHVEAANILGVFTIQSPSHNIIHISTIRALADAGHNITVVTMLPLKDKNPNYHHILIPPREEDQKRLSEIYHNITVSKSKIHVWRSSFAAVDLMNDIQQKSLKEPAFQELMNNKGNHFDLLILGYAFNDFLFGIADHFKCPVILTWVNVPTGAINDFVGNPTGVSYIPIPWLGVGPMGFLKRVGNMLMSGLMNGIMQWKDSQIKTYYEINFPAERGYRSLDEMKKNISLVFCSTFFSEGPIRPLVPNLIEIGGIQVKEKPDPLPKDIEEFLQTANEGVIFFSLGSNVKSADFNANATQVIFNVLSGRKEKVLWKWDALESPGNASNIMFKKWLPQDDILAHPKTKLFITHGGKGSITEAQYHGVPMLALPVFGDQSPNADNMQSHGYGKVVDYQNDMTEDQFRTQLEEVLFNTTYSETIKRYSVLYRDRPMTARKSVVYWTEYVIRYRGAKHMQSARVHLNAFQYNGLDVIGFLLAVLFVAFLIVKHSIRYVIKLLCRKTEPSVRKKRD